MKTLDEVIKAWKICDETVTSNCPDCPYDIDCENVPGEDLKADTLHYLKAFRDAKDALNTERDRYAEAVKNCEKAENKYRILEDELNDIRREHIEQMKNPPLDWDELKTMEGKPVWVEVLEATDSDFVQYRWGNGAWYIVKDFVLGALAEYCQLTPNRRTWTKQSYGEEWQAYRKERS